MHFYKAKYDASTPTKVQVNVATNTDFMVGTELYVKGEKKEITADNVKLIDTVKYPVQYSFASDVLEPDTEVNGIPAFTMKSLDAEADKLYDVEFKSEQDDVNVALSASSPMFNFLSATSSGYVYEATQDFTIEAPVYSVGSEYKASDNPTKLKAFKTTGENWFDGTSTDPWNLVEVVVDGVKYAIMPTNKATFDYLGLTNNGDSYFYISNTRTYKWMEKVTVPAGTQVKFVGVQKLSGELVLRVVRMLMGESYDYKFKLFINEDEQAYGDVQVGQEFENTITLSGTYEDDTEFSYTIPVIGE